MRLFGSKRGIMEDLSVYLIQLVFILGYTVVIFAFISGALKNTTFEKAYITRDLAFITDAILASPGNVFYEYNFSDYNFLMEFSNSRVIASDKDGKNVIYYSYASDSNYITKNFSSEFPPKSINLAKEGNVFRINKTLKPNLNAPDCSAYGAPVNPKKILIDIPHDSANPGYKIESENTELLSVCRIGNYLLHSKNPNIEFSFTHPVNPDGNLNCYQRNPVFMPQVDYVVVFHGGALMSYELSPAKAYVQRDSAKEKENSRLACQLVNSILSSEKLEQFTGSALISADSSLSNTHIQMDKIDPAISTIVLEIGNIYVPREKNQLFSEAIIGESIIEGLSSND